MNYQVEMEKIINSLEYRPRLLLHVCCAPCSSYVLSVLTKYFYIDISNCKYMACSGARAYRQVDWSADHLCSDAASGTCDPGSIWRRGYQINGGLRSISWDRTGSVRHVFRAADITTGLSSL